MPLKLQSTGGGAVTLDVPVSTASPTITLPANTGTLLVTDTPITGNVTITGTINAAAFIPTGSAIPVTGLYLPAANTVAFTTSSVEAMRVTSDGNMGVGTTNTSNGKLSVITSGSGGVSLFQSDTSYQYLKVVYSNGATTVGAAMIADNGNAYIEASTNHPLILRTNSTERGRFDTSGNFLFNSGYGSAAVAYGCRAWVNYNGTGTPAINGSGGVTSVTRSGTGIYVANLTTTMPDTKYAICVTGGCYFGVIGGYYGEYTTSSTSPNQRTTSAAPVFFQAGATNAGQDNPTVSISIFR